MATELSMSDKILETEKRLPVLEKALAKGLNQPFNSTNSAVRKMMYSAQSDQVLPLFTPEPALVSTGFEDEAGRNVSSYKVAGDDYEVIAIIPKFLNAPQKNYIIVGKCHNTGMYDIIEVKDYQHNTESYGFLLNNDFLNSLHLGSTIKKGQVVQRSHAFDSHGVRQDGINLISQYVSDLYTTEDSVKISVSAAERLSSPLIHKVTIVLNDNDIPLNLYGGDEIYKIMPDIGESVKDGILIGTRRRKNEDRLFTESYSMLQNILASDDIFTADGTVLDVNIYCNNPDIGKIYQNEQLDGYYKASMDFTRRIVQVLEPIYKDIPKNCSYEFKKLYYYHKRILDGKKFKKDKPFSNAILEVFLLKIDKLSIGDKITDRYGGKGVISQIIPDELMPILSNGKRVDIQFNLLGGVNRENPGQFFECSISNRSMRILDYCEVVQGRERECMDLYMKYMAFLNPNQAAYYYNRFNEHNMSEYDIVQYFDILASAGGIHISMDPISSQMSIDKLAKLDDLFPWIEPYKVMVPITSSTGEIRFIECRREMYIGTKYIYRLKQYAEDKFSATSLAATNIRNEPDKSKASKNYKAPYSKTPIRFGEMETGDMYHLNVEVVVNNLMLHSASPHGRRLAEKLFTDDPFNVNIELDDEAKNRNVEILNAYLKTMGLRLVFEKRPKTLAAALETIAVEFVTRPDPDYLEDAVEFVKERFFEAVSFEPELQQAVEFIAVGFIQ